MTLRAPAERRPEHSKCFEGDGYVILLVFLERPHTVLANRDASTLLAATRGSGSLSMTIAGVERERPKSAGDATLRNKSFAGNTKLYLAGSGRVLRFQLSDC